MKRQCSVLQLNSQLINMQENNQSIQLNPWISIDSEINKSQPLKYSLNVQQLQSKEVVLITILSIKPQTLCLIGKFVINHQDAKDTLAFLSPVISHKDQFFQIAYVPHREAKAQTDCLQSISDILRSLSEVVVTDVCCNGPQKYKDRMQGSQGKQYVIVNNKDIYQIEAKQAKIELTKRVEFSLKSNTFSLPEINTHPQLIRLDMIHKFFAEYTSKFYWFLNSDRSWKAFTEMVVTRYKSQRHLDDCFAIEDEKGESKFFTSEELQIVKQQILQQAADENSELAIWVASSIIQRLCDQNSNLEEILEQLTHQFSQKNIETEEDLERLSEQAQGTLLSYRLPLSLSVILTYPHEKELLLKVNNSLLEKQQILKQLVMQRNNQLLLKNHKIDQLKDIICEFTEKAEEMKKNTQQLIELTQLYDDEKQRNRKLQLEVDSHIFMAKKNAQNKVMLQNEIQTLTKEKTGLLVGLQEMTSQNLTLMSERQKLEQEIKDLKERIEDSNQVQARALRSIQNEAEVKVRLSRYQNYVQELKQVFSSFKRMEIEKFNYILQRNYKEYQELQERHRFTQFELRRSQAKLKEMTESLHCERVKLSYFQKMYASGYSNQPIPEVSQENSATDRECSPTA